MIKRYNINFGAYYNSTYWEHLKGIWCKYDDIKDSLIVWHDLRENPDDLPKHRGYYLAAVSNYGPPFEPYGPPFETVYFLGSAYFSWYGPHGKLDVIKWAEIKPPKE